MFEAGHPCVIQWLRHPVTQPSSDLVTKCFLPFLFVFFLVAFYSSLSIRSFSLKASLRALSDWSLQSCFPKWLSKLKLQLFFDYNDNESCKGGHKQNFGKSWNYWVNSVALSKEKKKGCFYTEISPSLIVSEKLCMSYWFSKPLALTGFS